MLVGLAVFASVLAVAAPVLEPASQPFADPSGVRMPAPRTLDGLEMKYPPAPQGFVDEGSPQAPAAAKARDRQAGDTEAGDGETPSDDAELREVRAEKAWYQALTLSGFVDVMFAAVFPSQANGFVVGEVELDLEKTLFDVAGLRLDLNVRNRKPWDVSAGSLGGVVGTFALSFDSLVEQAYAEWFPLGEAGPRLRLGKYNARAGFERQDSVDRQTATESLVFLHGSPANFTGVALVVPLPASLELTLHGAFNGWDEGLASRRNKSLGAQVGFDHSFRAPLRLSLGFTFLYGTERFANERDARLALFGIVALEYRRSFLVALETTWAREGGLGRTADNRVPGNLFATWFGLSAWLRHRWTDWLATTARYDYFNDPDRTRGLAQSAADLLAGGLTRRQQVTADLAATIVPGATVRAEYGADFAEARELHRVRALGVVHRLILEAAYHY